MVFIIVYAKYENGKLISATIDVNYGVKLLPQSVIDTLKGLSVIKPKVDEALFGLSIGRMSKHRNDNKNKLRKFITDKLLSGDIQFIKSNLILSILRKGV